MPTYCCVLCCTHIRTRNAEERKLCEVVVTPGPWTAEQRITVEETKRCTVGHLWRTTGTAIVAASFVGGKNSTVFTSYRCKRRFRRSVCHLTLPARCPRSTIPQQAVLHLHTSVLCVPMDLCFKICNKSPWEPFHMTHATDKLSGRSRTTSSLCFVNSPSRSSFIRVLCLPAWWSAVTWLFDHRWTLHPNTHCMQRPPYLS
nr:uncharacterized protein LOC119180120 [Rhipicephalus microplus]